MTLSARFLHCCAIGLITLAGAGSVHAAGGSFVVDDYAIDQVGECNVESWVSFARNKDFNAITSPACVVKLGIPVEISADLQRQRSNGDWVTQAALGAKFVVMPLTNGIGVGFAAQIVKNILTGASGANFYVPVTIDVDRGWRVNLNAGAMHDQNSHIDYLMWGAGLEIDLAAKWQFITEVFGTSGPHSEPSSTVHPRFQAGIRYSPVSNFDIDLIYGHNIGGEGSQWLTAGFNVRFDAR